MLELHQITKTYATEGFTQVALDGVSVTFRDNEFVAVLGPSGSGKTTMLNILGGLDHADSGEIVVNGVSTKDFSSKDWDTYRNHRVGFIFQSYNLIPHQSVLSNVELALTLSGVGRAERERRALAALADVGLAEHARKRPSQLSGGQMQRVAIARALMNDPDIVLADEPTGALDTQTSVQVMDILKRIASDRLVVMVTHNPELAERYATRIVRVRDGRVEGDTDPFDPARPEPAAGGETVAMPAAAGGAAAGAPADAHERGKSRRHASMGFLTALSLSANNLWSKKGRTILTAFAGSIGIIGIAAILAISNGVNNYIAKTEEDALSHYPLAITQGSANVSELMGQMGAGATESDGSARQGSVSGGDAIPESTVVSDMFSQVKLNDLASFKAYLDSGESGVEEHASTIEYKYGIYPKVFSADTSGGVTRLGSPLSTGSSSMQQAGASLGLSSSSSAEGFEELLEDQDLLDSQYDVVAGTWPTKEDEAVLVLDANGEISDYTLYCLGVLDPQQLKDLVDSISTSGAKADVPDTHVDLTYDDALGLTFKVVDPSSCYQYNADTATWTDMSGDEDFMRGVVDSAMTLRVVGVVRPNATTQNTSMQEGVAYTHALTQRLMANAASSKIVRQQLEDPDVDVFTGKTFEELRSASGSSFDMSQIFSVDEDALKGAFSFDQDRFAQAMSSAGDGADLSGLDLSGMDLSGLDLSGVDTSSLSSVFSPEAMAQLVADAPEPDLSKLAEGVDPSRQQAATAAAQRLADGFVTYSFANASKYTKVGEDGKPSFDAQAAWGDYTTTDPEGSQLYAEAVAAASAGTDDLSAELRSLMQDYLTDQFAPYFSERMGQLMSQAAEAMTQQLAAALQTQVASAADALGSELSDAISSQMQGQMEGLSSAMADSFSVDAFRDAIHFNLTQEDLTSLLTNYANASSLTYESNLTTLGYADEADPHEIDIYPKSFSDKEDVLKIVDDYNDRMRAQGEDDKAISYTDLMGTLLSSVTDIVNLVSTVLIAFVSISLVVSSIMIAIITYISVLERKKEIGILRAMGASKLNVANIFNAETFIEGLVSGVFAIVVVLVAEVPVNRFVYGWKHVAGIMALSPGNAVALVVISVLLTLMAGIIPSSIAARRDPVEALRSE
ncbi:MAG: ABC transporter ATP-binding protein/permease [Olsenella sp.]|jgi:putative ABC transport system permease protein